jgi:hypothetical protein
MKPLVIIGIIFMLLGVVALSYGNITYTKEEKIAEIGPFKATAEREKFRCRRSSAGCRWLPARS